MGGVRAANPRVSYADLERWPDDGRRYELYDGDVFVIPSPILLHQLVSGRLYLALNDYVTQHGGVVLYAPLDVVLTEYDVVQPDLLLFTAERLHRLDRQQVPRVPPDLAIEVLSPGTARNDRGRKKQLLARHGVREYWLVDPEPISIEIHSLRDNSFVVASISTGSGPVESPLLPALRLSPADLVPE